MNGDRIVKLMGNLELLEFAGGVNDLHAQSTLSARKRNPLLENKITGLVPDPSAAAPERSPVRMSANCETARIGCRGPPRVADSDCFPHAKLNGSASKGDHCRRTIQADGLLH